MVRHSGEHDQEFANEHVAVPTQEYLVSRSTPQHIHQESFCSLTFALLRTLRIFLFPKQRLVKVGFGDDSEYYENDSDERMGHSPNRDFHSQSRSAAFAEENAPTSSRVLTPGKKKNRNKDKRKSRKQNMVFESIYIFDIHKIYYCAIVAGAGMSNPGIPVCYQA